MEERVVVDVFAQDGRDRLVALVVRAGLDHVDDGPCIAVRSVPRSVLPPPGG